MSELMGKLDLAHISYTSFLGENHMPYIPSDRNIIEKFAKDGITLSKFKNEIELIDSEIFSENIEILVTNSNVNNEVKNRINKSIFLFKTKDYDLSILVLLPVIERLLADTYRHIHNKDIKLWNGKVRNEAYENICEFSSSAFIAFANYTFYHEELYKSFHDYGMYDAEYVNRHAIMHGADLYKYGTKFNNILILSFVYGLLKDNDNVLKQTF